MAAALEHMFVRTMILAHASVSRCERGCGVLATTMGDGTTYTVPMPDGPRWTRTEPACLPAPLPKGGGAGVGAGAGKRVEARDEYASRRSWSGRLYDPKRKENGHALPSVTGVSGGDARAGAVTPSAAPAQLGLFGKGAG